MISNEEIINRFDVLYNNTMSNQAPSLDAYEMSVFFNKAQLEVLKNHLNPKGNKYGEGFDGSSKRQLDFSSLTIEESYLLFPQITERVSPSTWRASVVKMTPGETAADIPTYSIEDCNIDYSSMLSIVNESLGVAINELNYYVKLCQALMIGEASGFDVDEDGKVNIADVTALIDAVFEEKYPKDSDPAAIINYLLGMQENGIIVLRNPKTPEEIIAENNIRTSRLVVVPLNNIEYDTLMSRPYKYPPKSQAWRILINNVPEFIIGPNFAPYKYSIRYIKVPAEVDLVNNERTCELPDSLIDEVLQRAVELAKNAWEGNIETTKALGERSE